MVIDSSALLAIVFGETDRAQYIEIIEAGLNFGDCMSYATAEYLNEPLLFKGDAFEHTPIRAALNKGHLP